MDFESVLKIAPLLTVILAGTTCGITLKSVLINRKTFRSQTQPKIIVYTHADDERDGLFMIRIQNIGKDVAEDITFETEKPIPRAMGINIKQAKDPEPIDDGPLIYGIPNLAPGEHRDITWGQYGGLTIATNGEPIKIKYRYHWGCEPLSGENVLEVGSYVGSLINNQQLKAVVKSLRNIEKESKSVVQHLGHIRNGIENKTEE
ncbi:MAG: hypothetical protein OXH06_18040 [Gemmatimonadetes bacterium]|nr:hypothetical protein [Gemmatimonadota bacterium]